MDADIVLEGGGVKGAGLLGALSVLQKQQPEPYTFRRLAGTSAGAIVASMLAAGMDIEKCTRIMMEQDFADFEDEPPLLEHVGHLGEAFGLLLHEGMYKGDFLHDWIARNLAEAGVAVWGDLKEDDPNSALPPQQRYKLVVIVSDVSRGLMLRLPWDYQACFGVDPDRQPVADAVRASAGIPFFFRPFRMPADPEATGGHDAILCTDGGMLSNYPIDLFDRHDGQPSRWPTLGVKLSARKLISTAHWNPNAGPLELAKSLLSTMQGAHDMVHVNDPSYAARTIFVDTSGYSATDFHLTGDDKLKLFGNGQAAATKFLAAWDWEAWKQGNYTTLT